MTATPLHPMDCLQQGEAIFYLDDDGTTIISKVKYNPMLGPDGWLVWLCEIEGPVDLDRCRRYSPANLW